MFNLQYALSQHQQGDFNQAEIVYRQLFLENKGDINVNLYLGVLLLQTKRAQEALEFLQRAYDFQPKNSQIISSLSDCLFAINRVEDAIRIIEAEAVNHSDLAIKHLDLLNAKGDVELSFIQNKFEIYESIWPTNLLLKTKLASIAKQKGELIYAKNMYESIIKLAPNRKSSLHNLAVVERLLKNPSRALVYLKKVASLGDDSFQLHHNLGNAYTDVSNLVDAVKHYKLAIERNPHFEDSYRNLTQILFELGDVEGAIKPYQEAMQKGHVSESLVLGYCDNLIQLKRYDAASQLIDKFYSQLHNQDAIRFRLAKIQFGQGNLLLASETLENIVSLPAKQLLCMYKLQLGDANSAKELALELISDKTYRVVGKAYYAVAQRLLGEKEYIKSFCNYSKLVQTYDLPINFNGSESNVFCNELSAYLKAIHQTNLAPLFQTLTSGTQTKGDILSSSNYLIQKLKMFFDECIKSYGLGLNELSSEHEFIPKPFDNHQFVASWSICLNDKGFHSSHVHPEGNLSAVFYVSLPDVIGEESDMGHLVFGKPNFEVPSNLEYEYKIKPKVGRLVVFPSYCWHGTIPFSSDEQRLTIAFDIISKAN
ncbi:tetratricopeptide repeat protein [Alteromonas sp. 5E99-2]|uniref:putative 2OG-Fe(II) oxygenase n=1 Tax=Alteromonas sp. 5E99-2 TaxID=2817683 RepID=UPI001A9924F7|nr:putative 2OG-Fe(II) oxygenase [Alteromonas sp. 5E99-2]MBO1255175.1 tetratricopeptide repeat protein [Alteromonas sp. 5E99-2]